MYMCAVVHVPSLAHLKTLSGKTLIGMLLLVEKEARVVVEDSSSSDSDNDSSDSPDNEHRQDQNKKRDREDENKLRTCIQL